jgi:hypothetical protein
VPNHHGVMKPTLFLLAIATFICTLGATSAPAADWITAPSYYTHDKISGQRVAQYTPIGPFYYYQRADFMRSGYRNYRSSIQAGGSADNMHIVEEWGNPVIPYEQWRFPYRPYGSPYQAWGPPFGGLGNGYGGGYGPGGPIAFPGGGFGGGVGGGNNNLVVPNSQMPQQWIDGYYPTYDGNDRSQYYNPY